MVNYMQARDEMACLAQFALFPLLEPDSESVSSHYLCLCCFLLLCLCQTSTLHSPSSLKPTPWQPVAVSPIKVDNLPVVPQQLNARSDSEACCIINQPRGAVRINDTREKASERESWGHLSRTAVCCSINFTGLTSSFNMHTHTVRVV